MTFPPDENHDLAQKARRVFDAEVEALDGATAAALRARRREALARSSVRQSPWWWPAGGMVTAALALALWLPRSDGPQPSEPSTPSTTASVNAAPHAAPAEASEALALAQAEASTAELENDADFYLWLATAPAAEPANPMPAQGHEEGLTL